MVPDWLARAVAARQAPAAGVALLALAAFGQALAQAVALASPRHAVVDAGPQPLLDAVALCLLALAATVPLFFLRPAAALVTIAAANVLLVGAFQEASVAGVIAQLIAAYRVGAAGQPRTLRGAAGASAAGWAVPGARRASALGAAATPYLGIALALPFLALALAGRGAAAMVLAWGEPAAAGTGIAVRARSETRTRTAAGEALADTMLAHTARGERARIARELHDVVAHHISMVSVQAETARLTTPGLPAAGAQRFAEIGDTARAGLTEMRRLLGVLREDAEEAGATVADRHPQPGLRQLAELVDAARDAAGTAARLIVSGPVAEFDPGVELAAYRIVQEALTNARRHAPGAAVDVELRYADDTLRLVVRDNGPGPGESPDGHAGGHGTTGPARVPPPPRLMPGGPGHAPAQARGGGNGSGPAPAYGGHGLPGMRERALAVGGALRTGAAPGGGFLVEAVLPAKPDVAVAGPRAGGRAERST
jgi:signal transduction histidine kinase